VALAAARRSSRALRPGTGRFGGDAEDVPVRMNKEYHAGYLMLSSLDRSIFERGVPRGRPSLTSRIIIP
jgi:hypothetical protein